MFFVVNKNKVISICCLCIAIVSMMTLFIGGIMPINASSSKLLPIYNVDAVDKKVALTFDCAWGADDIPNILETLEKNKVRATFFLVGSWVDKYPKEVKSIYEKGHDIGNHSNNHAHVNKLSYEQNIKDMKKCNQKIFDITNEDVKLYRGPYGEYSNDVIRAAESLNMNVIQWNVDTLDYTGITAEEMCKRIEKKLCSGSIILMHNDTKYTASGLQKTIDKISELGYEIVPVSQLIYYDNYSIDHAGKQIKK